MRRLDGLVDLTGETEIVSCDDEPLQLRGLLPVAQEAEELNAFA
jgi:hypothetical protein